MRMNKKVRLTLTKIKIFVVENKRISTIIFLSSILIIFFTLRPSIYDDKKMLKPLEDNTKLSESDSLENTKSLELGCSKKPFLKYLFSEVKDLASGEKIFFLFLKK